MLLLKNYSFIMCQYLSPAGPTISTSLNHSWPLESSCGFSHLRSGLLHISLRTHKAQTRGRKKRTNEHTRTWVSSKRKREEVCDTFVQLSVHLQAIAGVYFHKTTRNADSFSRVGQPGLCMSTSLNSRLSDFCSSLFPALLSSL